MHRHMMRMMRGGHHGGHHGPMGRGPFGFHGHRGDLHEMHEGRGGRRGRLFDHGDLRLVALKHIADKPMHGYELIKAVEEASGGAYSPSPGVVYPTLSLLEDMGLVAVSDAGGGRKLYTATDAGLMHLADNAAAVSAIFSRVSEAAQRSGSSHHGVVRAMQNVRTALKLKFASGQLTDEQAAVVAKALDDAAQAIEKA